MQAVTGKINEICKRYLENSRLALLPPPPSIPLPIVTVCAIRNSRRKMEDRHVILHDLNAIFNVKVKIKLFEEKKNNRKKRLDGKTDVFFLIIGRMGELLCSF